MTTNKIIDKTEFRRLLVKYARDILQSENFQSTRKYTQHGSKSVHSHCIDVAWMSLKINEKLRMNANERALVRGALLHDFFLYDWHDNRHVKPWRLHGFLHPSRALSNALREFVLSDTEKEIIKKHMWPLTVMPPWTREAWIVTMADKHCSLRETVRGRFINESDDNICEDMQEGYREELRISENDEKRVDSDIRTNKYNKHKGDEHAYDNTSLEAALIRYSKEDIYPYHMPGHKRNMYNSPLRDAYDIDITEVEGFDNLYMPTGILKEGMDRASQLYGSDSSYYLVNGSTGGILSAIFATTEVGNKVIMGRNCHISVYHACELRELKTIYIYPNYREDIPCGTGNADEMGIYGGITADQIDRALNDNKDVKAIIITSPTYEGAVSDVSEIVKIAHNRGVAVIVDEAHGAHFGMHPILPSSSSSIRADIVIHSLHKTLPAYTQTGLIHINYGIIQKEKLERYLRVFQTSSPSYILMSGIDACCRFIEREGFAEWNRLLVRLDAFYMSLGELNNIKVINSLKAKGKTDPSKIIIYCNNGIMNGVRLKKILLEDYRIELEMACAKYALAIVTIKDTSEGLLRLADAIIDIDTKITSGEYIQEDACSLGVVSSEMLGKESQVYVYMYPPGAPILVPGEVIDESVVETIQRALDAGIVPMGYDATTGKIDGYCNV